MGGQNGRSPQILAKIFSRIKGLPFELVNLRELWFEC